MYHQVFIASILLTICGCIAISPNTDANVEAIVKDTFDLEGQILLDTAARTRNNLLALLDNINAIFADELGETNDNILDSRISELTRDYINESWIIIKKGNRDIDEILKSTKRRIEQKLLGSHTLDFVERALKEMHRITWSWQDRVSSLLEVKFSNGQRLVEDMVRDVLATFNADEDIDQLILDREDVITADLSETQAIIFGWKKDNEPRLLELSQIAIAAGHEVDVQNGS